LSDILPLFPLSIVVFPGETVNLHIFEPRYKQMIHEAANRETSFGIIPYFEGRKMHYGAEVKLEKIAKTYSDGKMDIHTEAIGLFELIEFFPILEGKLYPAGEVNRIAVDFESDFKYNFAIVQILKDLYETMQITNIPLPDYTLFKTHLVAHKVGFNLDQEFEFMMLQTEKERAAYMLDHLSDFLPKVKEMESLRKKAEMNGHFKNLISPI